ncbi:MAG: FkbM family methyltransferase [Hyphomicrobiaceae bacterium]
MTTSYRQWFRQLASKIEARSTLASQGGKVEPRSSSNDAATMQSSKVALMRGAAILLKDSDPALRSALFDAFREDFPSECYFVERDGLRFLINLRDNFISKALFVSGETDYSKMLVAIDILKRQRHAGASPDLLVDVGANIGSICVPAVVRGLVSKSVAIEPQPLNCRLLRSNIALNDLVDRIEVLERAASSCDGDTLTMELSDDNWGDHRIAVSSKLGRYGEVDRKRIEVRTVGLDSIGAISAAERPLIWMDIQGYEGHALRGATRILSRKPPLVLEFWPYGMRRAESFEALLASTAHYRGFFDLNEPIIGLRTMDELKGLADHLGWDDRFTDILVI